MREFENKTREVPLKQRFNDLCLRVVRQEGLLLYDVVYQERKNKLLVYIMDNEKETATMENCVQIDKAMSFYISREDWIPPHLILEISSPGIERKLKQPWHFRRVCGKSIFLGTTEGLRIKGRLLTAGDQEIEIKKDNTVHLVNYKSIKQAHLCLEEVS